MGLPDRVRALQERGAERCGGPDDVTVITWNDRARIDRSGAGGPCAAVRARARTAGSAEC